MVSESWFPGYGLALRGRIRVDRSVPIRDLLTRLRVETIDLEWDKERRLEDACNPTYRPNLSFDLLDFHTGNPFHEGKKWYDGLLEDGYESTDLWDLLAVAHMPHVLASKITHINCLNVSMKNRAGDLRYYPLLWRSGYESYENPWQLSARHVLSTPFCEVVLARRGPAAPKRLRGPWWGNEIASSRKLK